MKIIEKSPAVLTYVCEACNTEYITEKEAIDCEAKHVGTLTIKTLNYSSNDSIYPDTVDILMKDGSKVSYMKVGLVPDDVLTNETVSTGITSFAIVDAYNVMVAKEWKESKLDENGDATEETIIHSVAIANAKVELKDEKLFVSIPDDEEITSDMNVCVKVINELGNEVVAGEDGIPFKEIVITAEVKQIVENKCIDTNNDELSE